MSAHGIEHNSHLATLSAAKDFARLRTRGSKARQGVKDQGPRQGKELRVRGPRQ